MKIPGHIERFIDICLLLILISLPVSLVLEVYGEDGETVLSTRLSIMELLVWLVFLIWAFVTVAARSYSWIKLPPAPAVLFLVIAVVSVVNAGAGFDSVKDLIQIFTYFMLGYMIFVNNVKDPARLKRIIHTLAFVTAVIVIYGVYQSVPAHGREYLVSSAFSNRNILSAYLTIVLPILYGLFLDFRSVAASILLGAVLFGGLIITTSLPSFIILGLTFLIMGFLKTKKIWVPLAAASAIGIIIMAPVGASLKDIRDAGKVLYEPVGLESYHSKVKRRVEMKYCRIIHTGEIGDYDYQLRSSFLPTVGEGAVEIARMFEVEKKDAMYGEGHHMNQRFLEWQAALNVMTDRTLFGAGIGNYEHEIRAYYQPYPKLNSMEPDSQNGYLIISFTMGIAGLGAFVWILLHYCRLALENFNSAGDSFTKGLSFGLLGSLIAFSANNFFSAAVNQSAVMQFVVVLSLIDISKSVSGSRTPGGRRAS